jgi:hypothetical protein
MTDPADYVQWTTDFPVHHRCAALHTQVNSFEADAKFWLCRLAELNQFGFSLETTPMLQLAADSRTLRALADQMDAQYQKLTQPEQQNENLCRIPV